MCMNDMWRTSNTSCFLELKITFIQSHTIKSFKTHFFQDFKGKTYLYMAMPERIFQWWLTCGSGYALIKQLSKFVRPFQFVIISNLLVHIKIKKYNEKTNTYPHISYLALQYILLKDQIKSEIGKRTSLAGPNRVFRSWSCICIWHCGTWG